MVFQSRAMYDSATVMTDGDGHNSRRHSHLVMDTESGAKSVPSRQEQELLTKGPRTADQLTLEYECKAPYLGAALGSSRQVAIATSPRPAANTSEYDWDARVRPVVIEFRAF